MPKATVVRRSDVRKPALRGLLERHANPQRPFPDHSAALSRRAVEHLKPVGQLDEFLQLQTGSACGVVDQDAFDDRRLGIQEDLGDLGNPTLRAEAREQSRKLLHDRVFYSRARHTGAREAILLRRPLQASLSDRSILIVRALLRPGLGRSGARPLKPARQELRSVNRESPTRARSSYTRTGGHRVGSALRCVCSKPAQRPRQEFSAITVPTHANRPPVGKL